MPKSKKQSTRKIVRQEMKKDLETRIYNKNIYQSIDWSGTITHVSDISQGVNDRVGQYVTPTHFELRYQWLLADASNLCRLLVVRDAQSSGTPPTIATILDTASVGTIYGPLAGKSNVDSKRFTVLYDSLYSLDTAKALTVSGVVRRKMAAKQIAFNGASTAPRQNAIYVVAISDSGASTHPAFQAHFELRYLDG